MPKRSDYRPGRKARVTEDTPWNNTLVEILDFPHDETGMLEKQNPWVRVRFLEFENPAGVGGYLGQESRWTMKGLKLEPYEEGTCAECNSPIYDVIDYLCEECRNA